MSISKKIFAALALALISFAPQPSLAALATGTIFQVQATATTGNVNGAGFNTANANFPTDLTATSATGNAPVLSSATYTFVAGDVGSWVYIKSGTNWTPGWYKITGVSAGAATVNAMIGQAIQVSSSGVYSTNTVAGIATTASPTAGTYGVDYSQQDTANLTLTDLASVGSSINLTSVTGGWSPVSVGNFVHITTTGVGGFGIVGWYEIVSYTSANQVVTDRTTNTGTAMVAVTGQTGGAGRLNGLEDSFQAMLPGSSIVWVKNGSYTFSGAVSTASTNCTSILQCYFIGYNTTRGDNPTGSNRPLFTYGANTASFSQAQSFLNIMGTGTASPAMQVGHSAANIPVFVNNVKVTNTSTTSARAALSINGSTFNSEFISQNGVGLQVGSSGLTYGNYMHDSFTCINIGNSVGFAFIIANITEGCTTAAITSGTSDFIESIIGNTIYGRQAQMGIGINMTTANMSGMTVANNILYGLATGIKNTTGAGGGNQDINNTFFNNTADISLWNKSASDIAVDPQFVGVSQLTGTTATSSGSVLTDSGASFGVTDNVDYLHVVSGTGVTTGGYLITSHTATTLTVNNALGTSVSGNIVYWVSHGHNFQIGSNLYSLGFPSFTNATGSQTTSFPQIGPVTPAIIAPAPGAPGGAFTF